MLVKIGFCFAVLGAAVLAQNIILKDDARAVVEASAEETAPVQEEESGDVLGRLRFVETGGVKSVFATAQRWSLPVRDSTVALIEDDTLLQMECKTGDTVSVAAAGEVLAVAHDETLGEYVRIYHGSDLESVYYNIDDIRVEVGQPLLAKDTLGTVGDGGKVFVKIMQSGAPQSPGAYLDVPE